MVRQHLQVLNEVLPQYADNVDIILSRSHVNYGYDNLYYTTEAIGDYFSIDGYPTSVVIDRYGVICEVDTGAFSNSDTFTQWFEKYSQPHYPHNLEMTSVIAPTCTESGYTIYACECGANFHDNIVPATGHKYELKNTTPPTCLSAGYNTYICSVCGDTKNDDFVEALPHNFVEGSCTVCGTADYNLDLLVFILKTDDTYEVAAKSTDIETIQIPATYNGKPITSIATNAFKNCSSLTRAIIPEGVTSIGEDAFSGCSSLTKVIIPEGVASIGAGAFYNCDSLANITIPNNVTSIGRYAFEHCSSLKSATFMDADGWKAGSTQIIAANLEDPSTAAYLLVNTYCEATWNKQVDKILNNIKIEN